MTIKQFLYSVRDEQKEIEELGERIYEIQTSFLPAAIRYDRDKVQTSPSDTISDRMAELADYEELLKSKIRKLTAKRQRAQLMVDRIPDSKERQVLDLYFLSSTRPKMPDVADRIGYSREQTYRYYSAGLEWLKMTLNDTPPM